MKQGYCPKCNSEDLSYEPNTIISGDECVYYSFVCDDCKFEGREYHNLHFTGFEDNDSNEINDEDYCDDGKGCKHLGKNL